MGRIRLFEKILDAVEYAHRNDLMHRDLSSNNILVITAKGEVEPRIIDWGLAKSTSPRQRLTKLRAPTMHGVPFGTAEYASPEQWSGKVDQVNKPTDVYSLGVHLYYMLTNSFPVDPNRLLDYESGRDHLNTYQPLPPSEMINMILPEEYDKHFPLKGISQYDLATTCAELFDDVVLKCLEKEPRHRYRQVMTLKKDIRIALRRMERGNLRPKTHVNPGKPQVKGAKQRLSIPFALTAICVILFILLMWQAASNG